MKPTEYEVKFANELIEKLMQYGLKTGLQYQWDKSLNWDRLNWRGWVDNNEDKFEGTSFRCGATKICVIDDRLGDWVLKAGFDRSTSRYYKERENDADYCELEAENYEKARAQGLERYFAQTFLFKEVDGVKFYWQEKVTVDEEEICRLSGCVSEDDNGEEYIDTDEFDDMCDDKRVEMLFNDKQLEEFIEENGINDLHSGNWGWTKDGRIVALDYSGFAR